MPPVKLTIPKKPSIRVEKRFAEEMGGVIVAGIDEAGRGPLAGPVVAAAVILPFDGRRPVGLNDSKRLNEKDRNRLFRQIQNLAVSCGIGIASAQEIDLLNILEATRLAVRRALAALDPQPGALVTDCLEIPGDPRPTLALIKGDQISASVSAASILAKVTRDRLMNAYSREFPEYGWAANKGYPTADHYRAIEEHGPTILHRLTFQGVSFFHEEPRRSPTYYRLRERIEAPMLAAGERLRKEIRIELESVCPHLPPPDYEDLQRLLAETEEQPGDVCL